MLDFSLNVKMLQALQVLFWETEGIPLCPIVKDLGKEMQ